MKLIDVATVVAFAAPLAVAAGEMKSMEMKDMSPSGMAKDARTATHVAKGTVKSVDAKGGTVTLDHEPVKSMKWPAMTMAFKAQDKALLDKLGAGKKWRSSSSSAGRTT